MTAKNSSSLRPIILAIVATSLLLAAAPASASKPAHSTSSIGLVLLNSADGLPHYGEQVTFRVSTSATDRPYVLLNCYQNGVWLYAAQAGFYAAYPYSQVFVLASTAWTGGAADCKATLGVNNAYGTRFTMLASTTFHVYA
jgi:hypothetical protein